MYLLTINEDFDDLEEAPHYNSWDQISYINRPVELNTEGKLWKDLANAKAPMLRFVYVFFPEEPKVHQSTIRYVICWNSSLDAQNYPRIADIRRLKSAEKMIKWSIIDKNLISWSFIRIGTNDKLAKNGSCLLRNGPNKLFGNIMEGNTELFIKPYVSGAEKANTYDSWNRFALNTSSYLALLLNNYFGLTVVARIGGLLFGYDTDPANRKLKGSTRSRETSSSFWHIELKDEVINDLRSMSSLTGGTGDILTEDPTPGLSSLPSQSDSASSSYSSRTPQMIPSSHNVHHACGVSNNMNPLVSSESTIATNDLN
ncbi:hypothetical protein L1987_53526 [Smallanthus sonchifolius]|uniref:Uncharacterized protein n=1 Tax=Smallanthus sonchifolius TaxID=185202 RepID=A0ACB9EXB2_9ASTR|nr:hypothetical protein L1987_53526 [Smallanthus sonchifolius]